MLTRIWLTYKQHRFETIAILVVCLGLTAAALIEAYRLNSMNVPLKCLTGYQGVMFTGPSQGPIDAATQRCNDMAQAFNNLKYGTDMGLVGGLLIFVPLLGGIILGAPLVAREIEQGTAPLSWALSGSRRRWLLGKVLAGVLLIVPLMLAVGLAANVLQGAQSPSVSPYASFENYLGRGVIDIFWALAAFAGTFALGTLLGRTLPAVVLALVVCFFVRSASEPLANHTILSPYAIQSSQDQNAPVSYNSWAVDLHVYQKVYLDGKPWDGDVNAWWMAHQPAPVELPTADASGNFPKPADGSAGPIIDSTTNQPIDPSQVPTYVDFIIPGAWYWNVIVLESAILLLGSIFCAGIAFVWVDRRRPY